MSYVNVCTMNLRNLTDSLPFSRKCRLPCLMVRETAVRIKCFFTDVKVLPLKQIIVIFKAATLKVKLLQ